MFGASRLLFGSFALFFCGCCCGPCAIKGPPGGNQINRYHTTTIVGEVDTAGLHFEQFARISREEQLQPAPIVILVLVKLTPNGKVVRVHQCQTVMMTPEAGNELIDKLTPKGMVTVVVSIEGDVFNPEAEYPDAVDMRNCRVRSIKYITK